MMRQTGCDAVIVGRGCLGRPWLFRELGDVFDGREPQPPPRLGMVVATMLEHARRLAEWMGEDAALRAFRRHATWYTKGFRGSSQLRQRAMCVRTLAELREVLQSLDGEAPYPISAIRLTRAKSSRTQRVSLPEDFWDAGEAPPPASDADAEGG